MGKELIKLNKISKSFSGVKVLTDINVTFEEGKVYALVGENGAGKSTLSRIITGEIEPTDGTVCVSGNEYEKMTIIKSRQLGIRMVQQELQVVPDLSITENIFIGSELLKGPFVNMSTMDLRAKELLETVGLNLPVRTPVGEISIASRQLVEICRAINSNLKVLILDDQHRLCPMRRLLRCFLLCENFGMPALPSY